MKHLTAPAVLVVVLSVLGACGDDNDRSAPTTTAPPSSTTSAPTTATTPSSTSSTGPAASTSTSAPSVDEAAAATAAVQSYIDAVAAGDLRRAWDLLDDRSHTALGGFGPFEDLRSALSEGIGAWSAAEERHLAAMRVTQGGPETWVVAVWGRVAQEGPPSLQATSMPVFVRGSDAKVSPFEDVFAPGALFSFDPPAGSEISADQMPTVSVPADLTAAAFIDDDQAVPTAVGPADGPQVLRIVPGEPLAPGDHAVTVVLLQDGDAVASVSAAYHLTG
jgi:hypothetical protein